jgi:hypothetical protein
LIAVLLMFAVASSWPGRALAAPGWSIQSTPVLNGQPQGSLLGVSCSASACTGVGNYITPFGKRATLAERWNGSGWVIQPTPNPTGDGILNDVSCASATLCLAAGESYSGSSGAQSALAEEWISGAWVLEPVPVPAGSSSSALAGVSCTSTRACTAVGDYVDGSGTQQPLAEVWNGSVWTTQTVGGPSGAALSRVSCSAASACTAIGSGGTLVERWDGSTWSVETFAPAPDPGARISMQVYGVSCAGASDCVAVGHWLGFRCNNGQPSCNCFRIPYCTTKQGTLVETWNGSSWVAGSLPFGPVLYGVSCTAMACSAVGWNTPGVETAAVRSNGGGWTSQGMPSFAGSAGLSAVSCATSGDCAAVGQVCAFQGACGPAGPGNGVPLAEGWNGTSWAVQHTPTPAGPASPSLSSVSCATTIACTAVGSYKSPSGNQVTLAEYGNGTGWSRPQSTANQTGEPVSLLAGVSCPTASGCIATGAYATGYGGNPPPDYSLAEGSNAGTWALQSAPSPAGYNSILSGVSCPAAGACMAVGDDYGAQDAALAELSNGTSWTIEPAPIPTGSSTSVLSSVSCPTATVCIAVGSADGSMLAGQWNGTAWTIQSPAGAGALSGVSCPALNTCMAVGSSGGAMLAQRWNGTTWTAQTLTAPTGATSSSLSAVSCPTTTDCTAAGSYTNSAGTSVTLAERWNGTTWTVQTTPNPASALGSYLSSVSCPAAITCIAAGYYQNQSNVSLTLAERYSG